MNMENNNKNIIIFLQQRRIENTLKHSGLREIQRECRLRLSASGRRSRAGETTLQLGCPAQNATPPEEDDEKRDEKRIRALQKRARNTISTAPMFQRVIHAYFCCKNLWRKVSTLKRFPLEKRLLANLRRKKIKNYVKNNKNNITNHQRHYS